MRKGTLIDATLVVAAVKPPKGNAGEVSASRRPAGPRRTVHQAVLDAGLGQLAAQRLDGKSQEGRHASTE